MSYTIETIYHFGALENSIHFVFDNSSKTCVIVDPAWDSDLLIKKATDKGYKITDIWLTHWHLDHTNAADEIKNKTGAKITIGVNDLPYLQINSSVTTVDENDIIFIGKTSAKVINTPGHSAGGVCFLLDKHIIVGDTLFVYGAGHCSLPGGSAKDFFYSMQKLKQTDDDVMLLCGHDYGPKKQTTMGEQKTGNAFLLIDNEADFVKYIDGMAFGKYPYPTGAVDVVTL